MKNFKDRIFGPNHEARSDSRTGVCLKIFFPRNALFAVTGPHHGMDPAAHIKISFELHPTGMDGLHQIIQDFIGHGFVKGPLVTITPEIELEAFKLHT